MVIDSLENPIKLSFTGTPDKLILYFLGDNFQESIVDDSTFLFYHQLLVDGSKIPKLIKEISESYSATSKKVILLILDDFDGKYEDYENLILLRFSARKSLLQKNEFVVPYLFECLDEPFSPCTPGLVPKIGFCGYFKNRKRIINSFERSKDIETDFIKRKSFWGGKPHESRLVEEFLANMRSSPFNLTPRGDGNFSMRFYQTLAAGRIPVLEDTDIQLPLDHLIDWDRAVIKGTNSEDCIWRVISAHNDGEVVPRQEYAAHIFHTYLSHKYYFQHISGQLKSVS